MPPGRVPRAISAAIACESVTKLITSPDTLTSQSNLRVGLDRVLLCHYAESRPEWAKYLFIEQGEEDAQRLRA